MGKQYHFKSSMGCNCGVVGCGGCKRLDCCDASLSAKCIIYQGESLDILDIPYGTNLEEILKYLDEYIRKPGIGNDVYVKAFEIDKDKKNYILTLTNGTKLQAPVLDDFGVSKFSLKADEGVYKITLRDGKELTAPIDQSGRIEAFKLSEDSKEYVITMKNGKVVKAPVYDGNYVKSFVLDKEHNEYVITMLDGLVLKAPVNEDKYVQEFKYDATKKEYVLTFKDFTKLTAPMGGGNSVKHFELTADKKKYIITLEDGTKLEAPTNGGTAEDNYVVSFDLDKKNEEYVLTLKNGTVFKATFMAKDIDDQLVKSFKLSEGKNEYILTMTDGTVHKVPSLVYKDKLVKNFEISPNKKKYILTMDDGTVFKVPIIEHPEEWLDKFELSKDKKRYIITMEDGSTHSAPVVDVSGNFIQKYGLSADKKTYIITLKDGTELKAEATSGELEKVTENSKTGWRIKGWNPVYYGNIGTSAIDLSISTKKGDFGATGEYSFACGNGVTASGARATAIGNWNHASGAFSIALGDNAKASGDGATAIGKGTNASGSYSVSIGNYTKASGDYSTAMGFGTIASGEYSTTIGLSTMAFGSTSTAMGFNSTASGGTSTAMGSYTTASGDTSTTMGLNTTASSFCETALGSYNTTYTPKSKTAWKAEDRLFVIGNGGNSTAPSNALIIYKSGKVIAPSLTESLIDNPKSLVTKEYVNKGKIYIRGTGLNNNGERIVKVEDKVILKDKARGLSLTVLDRYTLEKKFQAHYDVYSGIVKQKELATKLNSLDNTVLVILTSYDALRTGTELNEAMWRCGASLDEDILSTNENYNLSRLPYAFLGIPGLGKGAGLESFTTTLNNSPHAEIITTVENGVIQGLNNKYVKPSVLRNYKQVDLKKLDPNKYYPVTISCSTYKPYIITVSSMLSKNFGVPPYSIHSEGFSCLVKWETNGSGWGSIPINRKIYTNEWNWVKPNEIVCGSIGQLHKRSLEYIYLRGGSVYDIDVQGSATIYAQLHTTKFTIDEQTLDIKDTVEPIITDMDKVNTEIEKLKAEIEKLKAKP